MRIGGRILIVIVAAILAVAALFCIIGLATKGWGAGVYGLFCDNPGCSVTASALAVISFILLLASIATFILLIFDILKGILRIIPFVLLSLATIFLLATFTSYVNAGVGYSFNLMVAAHFLSYTALAVAAYWYGQSEVTSVPAG